MCLSTRIEGLNVSFGESGVRHGACVLSVTGSHGNGREAAAACAAPTRGGPALPWQ